MNELKKIITNNLSTLMVVESNLTPKIQNHKHSENSTTKKGEKITVLWVPGHVRIFGNQAVNEKHLYEKYAPQDQLDKNRSSKNKEKSEN
jgi:ArsR family metal-binding transcriptional regulator